ncbi:MULTISPECIES: TetR/AcrR family transcriptional regulator [Mycolicibacterium]|uniref:TetR/AcrR family transcriptional regulator n=1 Tax=Mycolicibacterium TaxID=1866885 RepID=UPI00055E2A5B|nr:MULTISPECIES: TetR/AcrR family transcriptional regulator [Mycolicibacterium]QZY48595.1 TetR/AcrR family transcriptional regulator [Mycolicibacterium austroafricanum]UJL27126.1 TetR/AcrR family transcriptional regulator [Mycolicibacterium vanbaalenii]WND59252.1 TetR/AcrR family transcriptional regulator [Mycolicibacterium vanbaalenii]
MSAKAQPSPTAQRDGAQQESRASRFMRSALDILGETGRTDFTVLEVVERSKTSLRAFYQHFATKDELLLALVERVMVDATERWRAETDRMTSDDALRLLIERISAPAESSTQDSINRGLTYYNDHLLETRPKEFAKVLAPLHRLVADILRRGIDEGTFRADLDVNTDAAILMHTVLGALRLRDLGAELNGVPIVGDHVHTFCVRGLTG